MSELIHEKLSEDTIGAAMKVLNALGPGLDEKLYENALVIELTKRGHVVSQQNRFPFTTKTSSSARSSPTSSSTTS